VLAVVLALKLSQRLSRHFGQIWVKNIWTSALLYDADREFMHIIVSRTCVCGMLLEH